MQTEFTKLTQHIQRGLRQSQTRILNGTITPQIAFQLEISLQLASCLVSETVNYEKLQDIIQDKHENLSQFLDDLTRHSYSVPI